MAAMADVESEAGFSRDLFENWTVQMRKGVLDLCILQALATSEWYGYALVKALVAVPGVGVAEGSIYPLLARLKRQGLVTTRLEESSEGPARKYYAATPEGKTLAKEMEVYFADMLRGVAGLRSGVDFTKASRKSPEGGKTKDPLEGESHEISS
jgi:PadR family transcriptional regulator PadR